MSAVSILTGCTLLLGPLIMDSFCINPIAVLSVISFIFHWTISFVCLLPFIASSIFLLTYIRIICSTHQVEFRAVVGMRNTYTQFNVLLSYLISKQGLWYAIADARSGLSAGQPPEYTLLQTWRMMVLRIKLNIIPRRVPTHCIGVAIWCLWGK